VNAITARNIDANFLIAFHSRPNYASILLSFRDMILGRTMDRRQIDVGNSHISDS